MSKSLRVGHYQCECTPGDYEANIGKVLEGLEFAERERLDIMVFPESFLTGYFERRDRFDLHSWPLDGPELAAFLERVARFPNLFMVGLNEKRDGNIYNTVILVERGEVVGTYRKAFPCSEHETPGREFPVFEKNGVTFGILICADGGYIEPTRILALKGARVIFAPHYNYIPPQSLISHFTMVRSDHTARAVENSVWFMRCNNVCTGRAPGLDYDGVGSGDSYLVDPDGEIMVRSQRHQECFVTATITVDDDPKYSGRSRASAEALLPALQQALTQASQSEETPKKE
jgi:predicted amidohydrolase